MARSSWRSSDSSSEASCRTSGTIPSPSIRVPLGVNQRAVVKFTPEPSDKGQSLLTLPFPKVVAPITSARPWSIIAPAKTSLALALNSFTSTTTGISKARPPGVKFQSRRSPRASIWYNTRPSSMNWLVTSTTEDTSPPGL